MSKKKKSATNIFVHTGHALAMHSNQNDNCLGYKDSVTHHVIHPIELAVFISTDRAKLITSFSHLSSHVGDAVKNLKVMLQVRCK